MFDVSFNAPTQPLAPGPVCSATPDLQSGHMLPDKPVSPRSLKNSEVREKRFALLSEPHIYRLTKFVDDLRERAGTKNCFGKAGLPHFDPYDGGSEAQCLFLLLAPGRHAINDGLQHKGSGFVSRDNDDMTAENLFCATKADEVQRRTGWREGCRGTNFPRQETVLWNVIPWYLGTEENIEDPTSTEMEEGVACLRSLLDRRLLPNLKVVVPFGGAAQDAVKKHYPDLHRNWVVVPNRHPGQQSLNSKELWDCFVSRLCEARGYLS